MNGRRIAIATCFLLGCVAVFATARLFKGFSPIQTLTCFLAPPPSELPQLGQPIVDAITSFHDDHEEYPPSLADLDVSDRTTFYGDWRYKVSADGETCTLAIGDYSRYLFEVWWTPDDGWYIDT
ncbi:MAG: hypothetical protein AAGA03_17760 [Planctomycetota bacterium]